MKTQLFTLFFFIITLHFCGQKLVINEISQGSGYQEYVEMVVSGSQNCQQSNCLDLRGYILDDNNGDFAAGTGTGIAKGAIKLTGNFWSCIPIGTVITVYNDAEINPSIPAQDLDVNDGNFALVIPISSAVFSHHPDLPDATNSLYSNTGWVQGGNWNVIGMSNANDAFQVINNTGQTEFSIAWGNNSGADVDFNGSAANTVFYNATDAPESNASWNSASIQNSQTAGQGNTSLNEQWISTLQAPIDAIKTEIENTTNTCENSCVGSISIEMFNSNSNYNFNWSNGNQSASISNLCAGNYTLTISDNNGCTLEKTFEVQTTQILVQDSVIADTCQAGLGEIHLLNNHANLNYAWPNNETTSSIYNVTAGTYQLTISDNNGCETTQDIQVSNQGSPAISINVFAPVSCHNECTGQIMVDNPDPNYTYTWSNNEQGSFIENVCPGTYVVTATTPSGCNATSSIVVQNPDPIAIDLISSTQPDCGISNGELCLSSSGPATPHYYNWSNGIYTDCNSGISEGEYSVTVTNTYGCAKDTSFSLQSIFDPNVTFSLDYTEGCAPAEVALNFSTTAQNIEASYFLNQEKINLNPDNTFQIHQGGTFGFSILITDGECEKTYTHTDSIKVWDQPKAPEFNYQITDPYNNEVAFEFLTIDSSHLDVLLFDQQEIYRGYRENQYTYIMGVQDSGEFCLESFSDRGCVSKTCEKIDFLQGNYNVYTPNAFTPGKNMNTDFKPIFSSSKNVEEYSFEVYDRWGGLFFSTTSPLESWNGSKLGKEVDGGTYVWKYSFYDSFLMKSYQESGFVVLIR